MTAIRKPRILRLTRAFCELALCSAFVLVPLLFQPTRFEYNHQVYDLPKETAWAVLLTGFICASFVLGRRSGRGPSMVLSILLLGVWLSCLRAVNLGTALADGFVASLLIGMPLLMGRSFRSDRSLHRAAVSLLAGGALAVFYALAQRMEWDPVLSTLVGLPEQFRLGSSLGSPARVALYVAGLLPLLAACFLSTGWGARRGVLALIGVAFVFVLFLGGDRVAFLVALVGCCYLILSVHLTRQKGASSPRRGMSRWQSAALLGLLSLVFVLGMVWRVDHSSSEAAADQDAARHAWKMVRRHALLGVGPGNWDIVFPLYHAVEYEDEVTRQPPSATLDVLRLWGEWGPLGVAGFVGFSLWLLVGALRIPRDAGREIPWWVNGSAGGVAGLFVVALLAGPLRIPGMQFLFWSLAAIALAGAQARNGDSERPATAGRWVLRFRIAGAFVLTALGVVILGRVSMPHLMASRLHLNGLWWLGYPKSTPVFERAADLVPYHPEIWADFADSCVRAANNEDQSSEQFKEYALHAAEVGEEALRFLPNEAALIFRYGNALDFQVGRPWEKLIAYRRAAELSRGTPAFHVALGRAYIYLSAWQGVEPLAASRSAKRAIEEWKTALALDPDNAAAAYNLALDARNRRQTQEALDYLSRILRTHPHHQKARELLEELGYRPEDVNAKRIMERIAAHWQAQVEANPLDPGNYFRAGEAYEELGREELATLMYKKAFLKDPEYLPAVKKLRARKIPLDRLLREGEAALGQ